MKIVLYLIVLFLVPCVTFAQNGEGKDIEVRELWLAPNYENIKRDIADSTSMVYYPRLLERLAKADTTLDIEDMRCIYYGYAFQPDFDPYGHAYLDSEREIRKILNGNEEPSKTDFERIVELTDKEIARKPTELSMYYYRMLGCYYAYGETDPRTIDASYRLNMLFDAIYSSGNGTHEAPFHLTTVGQSYFIMNMNKLVPQEQALIQLDGRYCDVYALEPNETGWDSIYFDIHECFMHMSKMFELHNEASVEHAGSQLELPLGTHFIIKLEGELDEHETDFKVVKMVPYDKVIERYDNDELFAAEGEAGTIEGYFCRSTYGGGSENIVLVFKSWCEGSAEFDTDIHQQNGAWEKTSNSGIWHKVLMTEMWGLGYDMLRISNIRKVKQ